jgi:cytoskeletal protein RodZ
MTKIFLSGVAALTMMSGFAFAQSTSTDTTISTQSTTMAPVVNSYSSNKSQKTIESNGTETEKSQSYTSGASGTTSSSSTQTTAPDGSNLSSSHRERTVTPLGDTTTINRTTTTTE